MELSSNTRINEAAEIDLSIDYAIDRRSFGVYAACVTKRFMCEIR